MSGISFNRDSSFKTGNINGIGGDGDIVLERMKSSSPGGVVNNNLPKFSNFVPERKTRMIRPILGNNKKVPVDSFGGLANLKKSYQNNDSGRSRSSSDGSDSDDDGLNSMISSNSSKVNSNNGSPYKNKYASSVDDSSEEGSDEESEDSDDDSDEDSDDGSDDESGSEYSGSSGSGSEVSELSGGGDGKGMNQGYNYEKPMTYEDAQRKKQKILFDLDRLQKQGHQPSKKYTMASNLEDMEHERDNLKRQRDLDKSIKFSRKALMMIVSGIEFVNGKFDPFDIKLGGWSEVVFDNINDYDEIFEELHDKYHSQVQMSPELRLIMTLAGSGFMFHLTNSLFKSTTPDLNDILKKNPDIVRSIQEAAVNNMNSGINSQFGANDPIGNMMKQSIQMKTGVPMQSRIPPRSPPAMQSMNTFGPTRPQATMRGPSGVEDLLNQLKSSGDDDISVSSFNMRSSGKKGNLRRGKTGGVQVDLTA